MRVECFVEQAARDDISSEHVEYLKQKASETYAENEKEIKQFATMLKENKKKQTVKEPSMLARIFKFD